MADAPGFGADHAWPALSRPWQSAFEEAWRSWCEGNYGVGAVLVDPADGDAVVATGRNRVAQREPAPRQITGNFMAHAEMNAFASMDRFSARGLDLYTTLEPCVMCAGAAILLNVGHVNFAVRDEYFDGLDELWSHHPYTRDRQPTSSGPLEGKLARFARVLPLSFTMLFDRDGDPAQVARAAAPDLGALAEEVPTDPELLAVRERGGGALHAITAIWDRL